MRTWLTMMMNSVEEKQPCSTSIIKTEKLSIVAVKTVVFPILIPSFTGTLTVATGVVGGDDVGSGVAVVAVLAVVTVVVSVVAAVVAVAKALMAVKT